MTDWLKTLGTQEDPMPDAWEGYKNGFFLTGATFGRRPSIRTGDGMVYYAAVHQVVFAIGAATSLPYLVDYEWTQDRPWVVDVRLSAHATFLRKAFDVGDLSVAGRDVKRTMQRRSHLRLWADEFAEAQKLLDG